MHTIINRTMPYVRRKYKRSIFRRRPKTSRYARKRMYKRMVKKTAVHTYRRMFNWGTIPISTDQHTAITFRLNMMPNYSEFQSMYDQYKVKKIIFRLERPFTSNALDGGTSGNTSTTAKFIRCVHDYDSGNALTTEAEYLQYGNIKSYPSVGVKPIKIVLYPKIQNAVFRNDSFNTYANTTVNPQWIDVANPDVNHYGIRLFTPQLALGNDQSYRLFATVILQCKNTR